jgi:hypothetical protein
MLAVQRSLGGNPSIPSEQHPTVEDAKARLDLAELNPVALREVGVATAGSSLIRQTGGSIGLSVLGALFARSWAHGLAQHLPANSMRATVLTPSMAAQVSPQILAPLRHVYRNALHTVFLACVAITLIAFALS